MKSANQGFENEFNNFEEYQQRILESSSKSSNLDINELHFS